MGTGTEREFLSWEDLIYVADLHARCGERCFSVLGGEPTLHPEFLDFLLYLLQRGFSVRVFTSGVLADDLLAELEVTLRGISLDRLSFICNLNDPSLSPAAEVARVRRFLEALGDRVTPGFNIYHVDFSLDFLLHYANAYGLQRSLRLGVAHPIVGRTNAFIEPMQMRDVSARLLSWLPKFERLRVRVGLDCGFPLCGFSDEDLGKLYRAGGGELHFGCCPAIDIGPDMQVWACFPLSSFQKRSLYSFSSLDDVRGFYSDRFRDVRTEVGGLFEDCDQCAHRKSGLCGGGCLAHGLNSMGREAPVRALLA
jgi:radical SAM protein with 4Fe4S-binding SPASM domain